MLGYVIILYILFVLINCDLDVKNFRDWGGIGLGYGVCGKEYKIFFNDIFKKVLNINLFLLIV